VPELAEADQAAHDQSALGFFLFAKVPLDADDLETPGLTVRAEKIA
jgi:hypothetical protein